jgi:hypothetical protein
VPRAHSRDENHAVAARLGRYTLQTTRSAVRGRPSETGRVRLALARDSHLDLVALADRRCPARTRITSDLSPAWLNPSSRRSLRS